MKTLNYVCSFTPCEEDYRSYPAKRIIVDGIIYELPITIKSVSGDYKYTYRIKNFTRSENAALGDMRIIFSYSMDQGHWSGSHTNDSEGNIAWFKEIIKEYKNEK